MNLVEVHFAEADKTVLVQPGTTLLDAAEMAGVEVLYGCTRGMCGTDAHRVEAGEDALEAPEEHERGTLERMGVDGGCRLLCCAKVRSGKVTVVGDALTG
ncbi:MAG: 2Fe-2S iron-sulfur cluster-binding protein [Planctomycetota bacterium]